MAIRIDWMKELKIWLFLIKEFNQYNKISNIELKPDLKIATLEREKNLERSWRSQRNGLSVGPHPE